MTFSVDHLLLRHFGLRENPFGVTPDPRFLFMTRTHREALASLVNGIECGFGFQVLIAQPGMGKTTLLFDFLERFQSSRTAFLFQQQHDSREFLQSLLIELKSDSEETSNAKLYAQLNHLLSEAAQTHDRVIVVVDEAQNLDDTLMETLRQLSNFETARAKLLQIVLAGQPQLAKKLARPEQEQLRQRVSTIARLSPLGLDESRTYLNHRLNIAGYRGPGVFSPAAIQAVWSNAQGIPRNMNTLCFNAMLLAYAQSARRVDEQAVKEAAQDLDLDYVLADVAGEHRPGPSFPGARFEERGVIPINAPVAQKQTRNPSEAPRVSGNNALKIHVAEPVASPIPIRVEERSANSNSMTSANMNSAGPIAPAPISPSPILPAPSSPTLISSSLISPSLPAPILAPVALKTSVDLKTEERKASDPTPVVLPVPSIQIAPPSLAKTVQVARTTAGTSLFRKVLWASALAAVLGVGLLFGHGLGARGRSQVEERPESVAAAPRVQEPPQVLEAPLAPAPKERESRLAADDGPEVIVRTFPPSNPSQPENAVQQSVKAIFFDAGSDVVSNRYDITLQRIAEILAASPQSTAIIEGHTDSLGEEPYNLELSTRRAQAIKDVLESDYNIPSIRLSTVGVGSSAPIESNSTGSGRAYNRRVEVRIMRSGS